MRLHRSLCTVQALGLALFLCAPAACAADAPAASFNPRRTPVVDVVQRAKAAVVNIHSERTAQGGAAAEEFFALVPSQNRINGMGTGIIIDSRGYILTNHHVVEEVNVLKVRLSDGTTASAQVVARDADADLALLKIDVAKPLPTMPLGTANDLMVGETVIAIGNAYGYEHTVTVGIVSAVKRDVVLNKDVSYKSLIQTDAAINPGNSGGPLLNINGELIGVNVAIRAGAQGIAFAIPVDTALRVAADMLSARRRTGVWHGLAYHDRVETESLTTTHNASLHRSLVVDKVEANTAASKAGLQRGDTITKIGDAEVASGLDLERALLDRTVNDKLAILVRRDGAEQKLEWVVTSAAERAPSATPDMAWKKLGVKLQAVSTEAIARASQPLHGGLSVVEVRAESPAGKAGIQKGDILVGLHQWEMLSPENVTFVLTHPDLASFSPLKFYIIRAGQVHRGWLQQID
jgi:serine protease Do